MKEDALKGYKLPEYEDEADVGVLNDNTTAIGRDVAALEEGAARLGTLMEGHVANKANPHGVTAAQLGAYTSAEMDQHLAAYGGHLSDKGNPHDVTAAQTGAYTMEETGRLLAEKVDRDEVYEAGRVLLATERQGARTGYVTEDELNSLVGVKGNLQEQLNNIAYYSYLPSLPIVTLSFGGDDFPAQGSIDDEVIPLIEAAHPAPAYRDAVIQNVQTESGAQRKAILWAYFDGTQSDGFVGWRYVTDIDTLIHRASGAVYGVVRDSDDITWRDGEGTVEHAARAGLLEPLVIAGFADPVAMGLPDVPGMMRAVYIPLGSSGSPNSESAWSGFYSCQAEGNGRLTVQRAGTNEVMERAYWDGWADWAKPEAGRADVADEAGIAREVYNATGDADINSAAQAVRLINKTGAGVAWVDNHFRPFSGNTTADVGRESIPWRNGYFGGTVHTNAVEGAEDKTLRIASNTPALDLQNSTLGEGGVTLSGNAFRPHGASDGAVDLGSKMAAWRAGYFRGNVAAAPPAEDGHVVTKGWADEHYASADHTGLPPTFTATFPKDAGSNTYWQKMVEVKTTNTSNRDMDVVFLLKPLYSAGAAQMGIGFLHVRTGTGGVLHVSTSHSRGGWSYKTDDLLQHVDFKVVYGDAAPPSVLELFVTAKQDHYAVALTPLSISGRIPEEAGDPTVTFFGKQVAEAVQSIEAPNVLPVADTSVSVAEIERALDSKLDKTGTAVDSAKLNGQAASYYATSAALGGKLDKTGTAADSAKLGGQAASYYATSAALGGKLDKTGTAADSAKLGGQAASYYATSAALGGKLDKTGTAADSAKLGGQAAIYYATSAALGGKLDKTGTAADSAKLGGQAASYYATSAALGGKLDKTGTAADSAKLNGQAASYYATSAALAGKLGDTGGTLTGNLTFSQGARGIWWTGLDGARYYFRPSGNTESSALSFRYLPVGGSEDQAFALTNDGYLLIAKAPTLPSHVARKSYVDERTARQEKTVSIPRNEAVQVTFNYPSTFNGSNCVVHFSWLNGSTWEELPVDQGQSTLCRTRTRFWSTSCGIFCNLTGGANGTVTVRAYFVRCS